MISCFQSLKSMLLEHRTCFDSFIVGMLGLSIVSKLTLKPDFKPDILYKVLLYMGCAFLEKIICFTKHLKLHGLLSAIKVVKYVVQLNKK